MTRSTTTRLRAYMAAGLVGLVASLAVGQPESALVGVSLLVLAVVGLESAASPALSISVRQAPSSIVEGEERLVLLMVESAKPTSGVVLDLAVADGLSVVSVEGGRLLDRTTIEVDAGEPALVEISLMAEGWGRRSLGPVVAYVRSAFGMIEMRQEYGETVRMVAIPSDLGVSELLTPVDTNLHSGDLVSKERGTGLEFAELRPYQHGDDPKSLNWRVSSRAGSWWVNDRHHERNGDVLLVVDAQTQDQTGSQILVDRAVRLAGALLREYGRRRYRIGLVTIDGVVRWVEPGAGEAHRRRILEQLLAVQGGSSNRHAIERAVLRAAKRPALVILLTPMLDDALAGLAHSMRISGLDTAIVEIDPTGYLPEPSNDARELGRRLWLLERDRLRQLLAADWIPVAPWRAGHPADVPLSQLASWRSSWRLPV